MPALGIQQLVHYSLVWIQSLVVDYAQHETMPVVVASLARHPLAHIVHLLLASQ